MNRVVSIATQSGTFTGTLSEFQPDPRSAVIFAHGLGSFSGNEFSLSAEERIRQAGLVDSSFRFSFHSHHDGVTDLRAFSLQRAISELTAAIAVLHTEGIEDISVVASSFGAQVTLAALADGLKVRRVFCRAALADFMQHRMKLVSPVDLDAWRKRGWFEFPVANRIAQLDVRLIDELSAASAAGKYELIPSSISLTFIHGTKDATIPWQVTQDATAKILHRRFQTIEDADHSFGDPKFRDELLDILVADWGG